MKTVHKIAPVSMIRTPCNPAHHVFNLAAIHQMKYVIRQALEFINVTVQQAMLMMVMGIV